MVMKWTLLLVPIVLPNVSSSPKAIPTFNNSINNLKLEISE